MGKGGRLATGIVVMAALAAPYATGGGLAAASPPRSAVWAQVGDTPADEARLLREVEASLNRKKGLDSKVVELDGQLRAAQSELRNAENSLYAFTIHERGTETKLEEVRRLLASAHEGLRLQAIAAYVGSPLGNSVIDLLRSSDLDQHATKQSYIRILAATQADLIATRERLEDRNKDLIEQLEEARASAQRERNAIASQKAKIQADRDAQAAVRYQVTVEISNHDVLLKEVISRKSEFQAQAEELERQSAAVAESLGRRSSGQSSSASASSEATASSGGGRGLNDPLASISIASAYGYRVHPIYGNVRLHTGVDLNASSGTPIRAAADGEVVNASWLGGYGNAVIIDHGGGLATLYAHQSSMSVRVGEQVSRGDVIGRVGCTGSCTGPHLHYEVRINGTPVDPKPYL